uniref:Sacsin/Nov domain-containing protein n=1 Tax=Rhizophagus irregularis (strain DAOM 181602 / DAOM 197198 / MUCL 43194) TaxID=747089 RepID=U9UAW9_RHIID
MSKNAFKKSIFLNPSKGNIMVNQRYLIDKILARYSTKFVIYRELMQNSDDANSSKVKIIFETKNPSTDKNILNDKIETIIYKNNGLAFKKEDWDRIQEIAVGNPGEQKIGAFGVGFYSLFSICEEPFVISNGKGMNFIWDHDQLLTVYGEIDGGDQEDRNWTTFAMRLREPDKFPDVEEFTLFLSDSLAFTSKIQEITVYFNNTQIIKLSKEEVQQATKSIDIKSEFNTYSPDKIFQLQLTSLNIKYIQMNVKRLLVLKNGSERQSLITDYQEEEISIVFKVADGILKITAKKEFSNEMKRITKKDLPEDTKIHMIFPEFKDLSKQVPSIFRKLLPYPEQGRMYVGFPTQQTIGCCLNLSAHVIPSVERESVDLVNNTLKDFNKEILNSAGILCSILYENEMNKIDEGFNVENMDQFEKRAAYVLRHFTFNKSTPNDFVGKIIEQQFFERLDQKLPILSTQGVLPITDVRIPNPKMEPFIKKVPIVPKMVLEDCKSFFKKANEMGLIKELSFQDVLLELSKRSLSEEIEIIALLEWWISVEDNTNLDKFTQFMQSATIRFINELKALDTIHYILDASFVTSETETLVPDDVLPYKISKNFKNSDMKKYFKWNKLPLVNWARFIVKQFDSEVTPTFAESVHKILAKNMNDTSQNDKNEIHDLFICKECIPTTRGMKKPDETYFQDVNLFPNLPVIQFQEFFDFQNLMKILGVNEVIKIDLILECASGENFDYMQLARYLGSMSDNLQDDEWEILKKAKIWSKEKPVTSRDDKIDDIRQKFAARELFVPLGSYREFCLPVIEWAEKWDHDTKEAKLLFELGLLKYPTLSKILELSAPPTEKGIRNNALEYFIKNFEDKYSDKYYAATIEIEFLPCSKSGVYAKPSECFINPDCEIMGFNVIDKDYRDKVEKLGVHHHPNSEKLFERLIENKLKTENEARVTFEYLETRDAFIESQWNSLSKSEFIPIYNKEHNIIQKNPHECFFKNSQGKTEEVFGEFFSFIDFGEAANRFLRKCGVKNEPPAIKIAELLVESSYKVWDSFKNDEKKYENYRFILQKIAEDFNTVKHKDPNLFIRMTKEPILLGVSEGNKKTLDSAKNIYINDNATSRGLSQISI